MGPEGDLAIPRGLRSVKLSPLSRAAGGASTVRSHADPNRTLASLWGLRNAKLSPLSRAAAGASIV
eukprot:5311884-Pyramimonas_sp.AAC.1